MLRFFQSLFQELSDLKFDFKAHKKRKVVVYTDAIFDEKRHGLGFIAFDQETEQQFVCDAHCPPDLMAGWEGVAHNPWPLEGTDAHEGPRTHTNVLELLAITAAVWTLGPSLLEDREVLLFCDNTAAMSAAVHGSGRARILQGSGSDELAWWNAVSITPQHLGAPAPRRPPWALGHGGRELRISYF